MKTILLFLILLGCSGSAEQLTTSHYDNTIVIYNDSQNDVGFSLSFDDLNWMDYTVSSLTSTVYGISGNTFCYISIPTYDQGKVITQVDYQLYGGHKYRIYWNTYYPRWDLAQIE